MKVLSAVIALALFSSMFGIAGAFETQEKPYLLGKVVGVPGGCMSALSCLPCEISLFCPVCWPLLCLFMCSYQYIIRDILSLCLSTVMRYVSLYMIPSVYDLVDTVLPFSPEQSFVYIVAVLSCLKGFFDGAWRLGRLSLFRFCLSPAGKVMNGLLADMNMDDYYKRAELIEKGVPVRDIE